MDALSDLYQSILLTVKRSFDYSGRSTRKEYWLFWLLYAILGAAQYAFLNLLNGSAILTAIYFVLTVLQLLIMIPGFAVGIRRLHDTDRAGWWVLLLFATFIGQIVLLVFLCQDGTASHNSYGPDPKGRDVGDIFA